MCYCILICSFTGDRCVGGNRVITHRFLNRCLTGWRWKHFGNLPYFEKVRPFWEREKTSEKRGHIWKAGSFLEREDNLSGRPLRTFWKGEDSFWTSNICGQRRHLGKETFCKMRSTYLVLRQVGTFCLGLLFWTFGDSEDTLEAFLGKQGCFCKVRTFLKKG